MSSIINKSTIILEANSLLSLFLDFIFLIYIFFKSRKHHIEKLIGFYLYCLSICSINISLLLFIKSLSATTQLILSIVPIIASITLIFLNQIFKEIIDKRKTDSEYNFLIRKYENDEKYYSMMNEYANKLSIMRHDFKHQIEIAYYALENKDNFPECQKLLNNLSEELETSRPSIYCNSRLINIILSMKIQDLTDKKFKVSTDVILSSRLNISENIICSIINNVFDEIDEITNSMNSSDINKIEVTFNMKNTDERIIIQATVSHFTINDYDKFESIKKYYNRYIQYILSKYDSDILYSGDNSSFKLTISIFNKSI